ncbi:hypothetical protein DU508_03455 [Pedobacter chinensis]|uniref:Uncharacterized protein n=1 Tax=Pedobacter chinensis TaxID=2282421 RepID=A0A369Q6V5_9SPHI|nr:hypothetical protein DU508_03455 [Pedobacter chinensis]
MQICLKSLSKSFNQHKKYNHDLIHLLWLNKIVCAPYTIGINSPCIANLKPKRKVVANITDEKPENIRAIMGKERIVI